MTFANFGHDGEISTEKRRSEFCHEFLKWRIQYRPVHIAESFQGLDADSIGGHRILGPIAARSNVGIHVLEAPVGMAEPLHVERLSVAV